VCLPISAPNVGRKQLRGVANRLWAEVTVEKLWMAVNNLATIAGEAPEILIQAHFAKRWGIRKDLPTRCLYRR